MKARQDSRYPYFLALSIALHIAIVGFVLFSFVSSARNVTLSQSSPQRKVLQAVAVTPKQVQQEINKIKAAEQQKHSKELAQLKKLQRQQQAAKQARQREQSRLAKLKVQQKKLLQQRRAKQKAAAAKLAKLKKQQVLAQKRLKNLAQKRKLAQQKVQQERKRRITAAIKKAQDQKRVADLAATSAAHKAAKHAAQQQMQSEIDRYSVLIKHAIGQHWIVPANSSKDISAKLLVRVAPGGSVLGVSLIRSSGNPALDRSAIAAVYKASPLPVPDAPNLFAKFRELSLIVKPEQVMRG